ncbi:MAG: GAF domain-containing protein, partial [Chitinophagaceae bacterium]
MYKTDISNCDREPIHIPGRVQSHGFLLAIHQTNYTITYLSDNVSQYLGEDTANLLGSPLTNFIELLDRNAVSTDLIQALSLGKSQGFDLINPYKLTINGNPFYLIIHLSGENLVLEFETATLQYDVQHVIGRSVADILSHRSIEGLLQRTAEEIKNMIEYDRVMVYKFLEDGHGEVIAEVKNEDLEPFLGLHYPASDIPKQARELYKLNMTRIIADVNSESAAISTFETETPLDLTHSTLRAVSPVH